MISLTPEQRSEYQQAVTQEKAGQDENLAMARRLLAELKSPGLLGDMRRFVAGHGAAKTAELCSVPKDHLESLLSGGALSADELDAIAQGLGLRLTAEIQ